MINAIKNNYKFTEINYNILKGMIFHDLETV